MCRYGIVLDSDWAEFDGHSRNAKDVRCITSPGDWNNRPHSMMVYTPSRTVVVYGPIA